MIPGHQKFIEAIHAKHKVCVRYYSNPDGGVVDRVCAPLDYGTGGTFTDGLNRYWFWDFASNAESRVLGLVPQQITDLRVLGEDFDPAHFDTAPHQWCIARDWGLPSTSEAGHAAQPGAKL